MESEHILDYYTAKARDLPAPKPNPVSDLLRKLDDAVITCLLHEDPSTRAAIHDAFEAVLNHPESTWTRDVLAYRVRQLHYH